MNLEVITGCREYLAPRLPPREELLEILRRVDAGAALPLIRWLDQASHDHSVLYDEPGAEDARVALFLEYVEDACDGASRVFVLLPSDGTDRGKGRVRHFVAAARARFGAGSVQCRSLFWSDNTQAVLARLDGAASGATGEPATPLPIEPLGADRASAPGLLRNYAHAVLARGERIVREHSLFVGTRRAELLTELLEHNRLLVDPGLGPDRIVEALRPGGELFELLTKPLPLQGSVDAPVR